MQFSAESVYHQLAESPPKPPKAAEDSFVDENDTDLQYTQRPRLYGDGEIRIGTYLSLNEDIYSLGFASMVRNELIDKVILKESAERPKQSYQPAKTPKGSYLPTL